MTTQVSPPLQPPAPRKRADGQRSRDAILLAAARLATTRGLAGLSIGDLAEHIGMSKSGLYAHFKSKEELELATIRTAADIFQREVLAPAQDAPPGVARLLALADAFLSHLERRVFPGGCFFAALAAELDSRPGPARDRVADMLRDWMTLLEHCVRDAQRSRDIDPNADPAQVAFEVQAMLALANITFAMHADPAALRRSRRGVEHVLARSAPATRRARPRKRP